jgi:hypothetical protein
MVPNRFCIASITALLAGFASVSTTDAEQPLSVFVEFDFGSITRLKSHPKSAEAKSAVARKVIETFKKPAYWKHLPWDFRVGEARYPKLRITLVEDARRTRWELYNEVYDGAGTLIAHISSIVSEPGDLEIVRSTPRLDQLPDKVSEWVEVRFLRPDSGRKLHDFLKPVAPLGRGLVLIKPDALRSADQAEGIILLDWEPYKVLSKSVFTAVCPMEGESPVKLLSVGTGKMYSYCKSNNKEQRHNGMLVRHMKWEDAPINESHISRFRRLNFGDFFIETYIECYYGQDHLDGPRTLQMVDQ